MTRCESTGKFQYDNATRASKALRGIRASGKGGHGGYPYKCPDCRFWHVSSSGYNGSRSDRIPHKNGNRSGVRPRRNVWLQGMHE